MHRQLGVTVIGGYFLLAGVYLCSVGTMMLLLPTAIPGLKAAPFVYGLRSASPILTLLVGMAWALVGWGLFRRRNWARFAATLMLSIGIAWALPMMLLGKVHFGWRLLAACLEIALRAVAIVYLLAPAVMDSFGTKSRRAMEIR